MKNGHGLLLAASLVCSFSAGSPTAIGQSVLGSPDSKGRMVYREETPDASRGWSIVTKTGHWSLAFDPHDHLEKAHALIGKSNPEALADALEKFSAWVRVAYAADIIDEPSGAVTAMDMCVEATESLRSGSQAWNDENLTRLIAISHLAMAKSHLLKAASIEDTAPGQSSPGRTPLDSDTVREAAIEIHRIKQQLAVEQYRYDNRDAYRHLTVARVYYQTACQVSGMADELPDFVTLEVPPNSGTAFESVQYYHELIRPRMTRGLAVINSQSKELKSLLRSSIDNE